MDAPIPRMVLQIHDELVFDVQGKAGPIKELKKVIIACMEQEVRPLEVVGQRASVALRPVLISHGGGGARVPVFAH